MSEVLALIPARAGSKQIPEKNFRELAGTSPIERAALCVKAAGIERCVVSSDSWLAVSNWYSSLGGWVKLLHRPAALASDTTPMFDVISHALSSIPGPPEQVVLLVQPTQPLRQPKHLRAAIDILLSEERTQAVVSVVRLQPTYHFDYQMEIKREWLCPLFTDPDGEEEDRPRVGFDAIPSRRQDTEPVYIRDGTVYAFRRGPAMEEFSIYGDRVRPLVIPASETCALDTPEDWAHAEALLAARR